MRKHWLRRAGRAAALALVLLGVAAAADEQGAGIKTPQRVRIYFVKGSALGTLVSVSDTEVEFQLARPGATPMKYKVENIKAIQAADGVYVFNADKGIFENQKGAKAGPGATAKGPAEGSRAVAAGLQFVVADGTGDKKDAATADAARAALLKVVRTLVDAITLAKEEKTIADQVLTSADQLVKSRRVLSTRNEQDKVRVRLAAGVDRRAVAQRLEKAGLKVKDSRKGTVPSADDIRAHPAEIINEVLVDLPLTMAGEAKVVDVAGPSAVKVDTRLWTDWDKYRLLAGRLKQVLDVLKVDHHTMVVETAEVGPERGRRRSPGGFMPWNFANDGWVLWFVADSGLLITKMTWEQYLLGVDYKDCMVNLTGRQYLLITVLGPTGAPAGSELFAIEPERGPAYLETVWHKWFWTDLLYGKPERNNFFLTPVGMSLAMAKNNQQLDCILERRQSFIVNVAGIDPRQIIGAVVSLVVLPD
jgi:hypothetical protein